MGASQSPARATPPRAPKRGGPGAPMAHRGRGPPPPPPPRPGKDFGAPLSVVNGTLMCPPQEDPHPYRDLLGGFSKHLEDALFPPCIIRRGSMTPWEAPIVGEEWAHEWGRWCAATRAPEAPAQRHEGWRPHTRPQPTMIQGAGPDHPLDAAAEEWLRAAPGATSGVEWRRVLAHPSAIPPATSSTPPTCSEPQRYTHGDATQPPSGGSPRRTEPPGSLGALQKWGACVRRRPVLAGRHSGAPAPHAPHQPCSRAAPGARHLFFCAALCGQNCIYATALDLKLPRC